MSAAKGKLDLAERHQLFLLALQQRDRDAAMRQVEIILTEYPQLTGKYCAMTASMLAQQGQFDLAVRLYGDALTFDPEDTLARLYLGIALQRLGREGEARAQWAEIARRHPERPEARLQLALTRVLDGDRAGAEDAVNALIATLPPDNPLLRDARLVFALLRAAHHGGTDPALTSAT